MGCNASKGGGFVIDSSAYSNTAGVPTDTTEDNPEVIDNATHNDNNENENKSTEQHVRDIMNSDVNLDEKEVGHCALSFIGARRYYVTTNQPGFVDSF